MDSRLSLWMPILLAAACAEGLPASPGRSRESLDAAMDAASSGSAMEAGAADSGTAPTAEAGLADAGFDAGPDPCMDGEKNGLETDTDCGGPKCEPCTGGDNCIENTDCVSGTCEPDASVCTDAPDAGDGGMATGDPCPMLTAPEPACMCHAYAGKGYFFCPGPKDWNAARMLCMAAMTDLVAVGDQAEETFLEANVSANSWIGAANVGTTSWIWTATATEFWNMVAVGGAYANWAPGNPLAAAGFCAMMQLPMKKWATLVCSLPSGYVCEQQ